MVQQCPGIGFEGDRLSRITWHHLLQQTSECQGTCLGIPEQVDRFRWLPYQTGQANGQKGYARPLGEPGSRYEYNDVRINQLSLTLLHLFKDAPRTSWFAIGAGSSITWVDPVLELVCIMRWMDAAKTNDCIAQVMQSLKP